MAVLLVFIGTCPLVNACHCRLSTHVRLSACVIVVCVRIFECRHCYCSLCAHVRLSASVFAVCVRCTLVLLLSVCAVRLSACFVAFKYVYPNGSLPCCYLSTPVRLFCCCECAHALRADLPKKRKAVLLKIAGDARCPVLAYVQT
jgi:hypothetical protein